MKTTNNLLSSLIEGYNADLCKWQVRCQALWGVDCEGQSLSQGSRRSLATREQDCRGWTFISDNVGKVNANNLKFNCSQLKIVFSLLILFKFGLVPIDIIVSC